MLDFSTIPPVGVARRRRVEPTGARRSGGRATVALILLSAFARAEPTPNDAALAQSLFEQGKQLMDAGNYAAACSKLQESQRLDPGGGTMLNLALCREHEGRLASAWTDFKTALSYARKDGREDRARAAEDHITALDAKVPRLTVDVSAPADGEEIFIDGSALRSAGWGIPIAIDPGTHEIRATAPGKRAWNDTIEIEPGGRKTVEVPLLAVGESGETAGPGSSSGAPKDAGVDRDGSGGRTAGWILGGTGVVAIGLGGFFGLQALAKRGESDDECPTDTTCSSRGVELNDQAKTAAWIANVGVGVGIVAIGVGTYLILSSGGAPAAEARRAPAPRVAIDAEALPGGGRVVIGGGF